MRSNSSRVVKWYSRPSSSEPRGARVVQEMAKFNAAHLLAQLAYQRAFAGARRRRNDEENSCHFLVRF